MCAKRLHDRAPCPSFSLCFQETLDTSSQSKMARLTTLPEMICWVCDLPKGKSASSFVGAHWCNYLNCLPFSAMPFFVGVDGSLRKLAIAADEEPST